MARLYALLLLAVVGATESSKIVFPTQLDHAEGSPCFTVSGTVGKCSRSCEQSSGAQEELARCGNNDSSFLVCCSSNSDVIPDNPDVSAPFVTFDCAKSKPQVIGGTAGQVASGGSTPRKVTWPWMALIGRTNPTGDLTWYCAGMLINRQWILSEVSCFINQDAKHQVVRLGEYDFNDDFDGASPQDFKVAETVSHPEYSFPRGYHSLTLVKLDKLVKFQRSISPVCLPWGQESNNNIEGRIAKLLTFNNSFGSNIISSIQREIELTVFPAARCDRSYSTLPQYERTWPQGIGEEILCVGDPDGLKDACTGDGGAPLVTEEPNERYVVAGIVSSGYGCRSKEFPGLYVNLRHKPFLTWIKEVAFSRQ